MFVERDYSLIKAFTFTILARFAKWRVERVYWKHKTFMDTVAIRNVFEFPPRESLSKLVSFESRYGIWDLALSQARALMTIPSEVRDLLMLPASFNRSPEAAVIFCLSDPARSTKCSLGVLRILWPLDSMRMEKLMVKMEWDLEDSLFINVSPTWRLFIPSARH